MRLAHLKIENINGTEIRREQTLLEHTTNVANYAYETLEKVGLGSLGKLIGLLHDMGKATNKFNDYLLKSVAGEGAVRGSVDHSSAGVLKLFETFENKGDFERSVCELAGYAIGAHHGLFDAMDVNGESGYAKKINRDKKELCYDEAKLSFQTECVKDEEITRLFNLSVEELKEHCKKIGTIDGKHVFYIGLTARLALSALMDGDRRDAAEFEENCKRERIGGNSGDMRPLWREMIASEEKNLEGIRASARVGSLSNARKSISEACRNSAQKKSGIYRLSVPTGAGKTLASLRYALFHAEKENKRHIFYIAPLLTILDQNAKEICRAVGKEEYVLEHTSDAVNGDGNDDKDKLERYELLTEDWNAPIIVTTLVQFLNTLFSAKTSSVRRFCALQNSVIVIDEIQSLPLKLTNMTNAAINYLAGICGCSVVLCSATQPYSKDLKVPLNTEKPDEMVILSNAEKQAFKRNRVVNDISPYGMTIEELAALSYDLSLKNDSLLVICNTKTEAARLYEELSLKYKTEFDGMLTHLSAGMCKKHREDILNEVKNCLRKKRVICISTQVVEAGVDVSFGCVIRVLAGIDNLAQAAGRCNRSHEYDKPCEVHFVKLKNEKLTALKEIEFAQNAACKTAEYIKNEDIGGEGLLSENAVNEYYRYLYATPEVKDMLNYNEKINGCNCNLFSLLSENKTFAQGSNTNILLNQSFKTAGKLYKVFDENTTSVIVPYNEEADKIIAEINSERAKYDIGYMKDLLRLAKPYLVTLYKYQLDALEKNGGIFQAEESDIIILQKGFYDLNTGVRIDGYLNF